jgi:hypothetical protein
MRSPAGLASLARLCGATLKRVETAGLAWPLPEGMNDEALDAALYDALDNCNPRAVRANS